MEGDITPSPEFDQMPVEETEVLSGINEGQLTETASMGRTTQAYNKSKWKDLVTPQQLPKPFGRKEQASSVTEKGTRG